MLELHPCDWGVVVPLEICPSQTCYCAKSGRFRSNDTSIIAEIPRKIQPLTSSFQGHSRSFGAITDQSATYDFIVVIRSNQGLILCHF